VFAGVGLVVVLTPDEIRLLQLSHHRGGASWGIAGELVAVAARGSCRFVRVWFLDVVVVSRSTTASVDFVLRLQPRRAGVPSVAAVELVSLCTGGPSPAVLAAVLLQVVRPALVGDSYLPAGRIRAPRHDATELHIFNACLPRPPLLLRPPPARGRLKKWVVQLH
jgi:hypothetical protein